MQHKKSAGAEATRVLPAQPAGQWCTSSASQAAAQSPLTSPVSGLRHFGDAKGGAELGRQFTSGCADGAGTAGSGMAHLVWGRRLWEWL